MRLINAMLVNLTGGDNLCNLVTIPINKDLMEETIAIEWGIFAGLQWNCGCDDCLICLKSLNILK